VALDFEWDAVKARANARKHGVSFHEAATVFTDPQGRVTDDPRHSTDELRYVLIGYSAQHRLLAVMFTERGPERLRLISARRATRHERTSYEEDF
jgi:uncharacterized DUF497 family protein